jgi:hypothetical protein
LLRSRPGQRERVVPRFLESLPRDVAWGCSSEFSRLSAGGHCMGLSSDFGKPHPGRGLHGVIFRILLTPTGEATAWGYFSDFARTLPGGLNQPQVLTARRASGYGGTHRQHRAPHRRRGRAIRLSAHMQLLALQARSHIPRSAFFPRTSRNRIGKRCFVHRRGPGEPGEMHAGWQLSSLSVPAS